MTPSTASSLRAWILALSALVLACGNAIAQIVINEVLAENRLTILDDDTDDSDWVELFNAGAAPQSLAGYTLSDDLNDPRKWTFPDSLLGAGDYALVWCSGKDRTQANTAAIERAESTVPFSPTLVSLEADWQYLTAPPDAGPPPAGWTELTFNDAAWNVGRPGFGFGDDDDQTTIPMTNGVVFLRHVFAVPPDELPSQLVFRACYDDGIVVFLNGSGVLAENVGEGELTFASTARTSRECRGVSDVFDLSEYVNLLAPGDNVLAIALLNVRANNNDMSLTPELGIALPVLHTNFKIKSGGETLILTDLEGTLADLVTVPRQAEDHSFGRFPDGGGEFFYLLHPTPKSINTTRASTELIPNAPSFEPSGGRHTGPVHVTLSAGTAFPELEIRYTLDGTHPSPQSSLFEAPIPITTDTVIRAAAFLDGEAVTRIVSGSYFLSPLALDLTLPVLSISMAPGDFEFVHLESERRGDDSEKPAYLEVFDEVGTAGAATGFGMRLHGGAGRQGDLAAQKSYKAYFRRTQGDKKLHHPMFPSTEVEEFDRLVLRSTQNDSFRGGRGTYLRDQLMRDLHEEMGSLVAHGFFYHVFVNMEYRGLYNVVERIDASFMASHRPQEGEDWDVMKRGLGDEALDGTPLEWARLSHLLRSGDVSREDLFEKAAEWLDLDNFTAYMIVNIWAQNQDWPQQNWYSTRPRRDDGRWRFVIWDAESGLGPGSGSDTLAHVFSQGVASLTIIFEALLESLDYQEFFLDEMERHLSATLAPDNVVAHLRRSASWIEPDIHHAAALTGFDVEVWRSNVDAIETFARERIPVMREFVRESDRFAFSSEIPFQRGDANGDGSLNVVDPIRILGHLLAAPTGNPCSDAMDVDDLGTVEISDAILLLDFLFQRGSPPPAAPHGECGADNTADDLPCDGLTACQ
jgi:hypothetical protein